jgi:hypothetical protein
LGELTFYVVQFLGAGSEGTYGFEVIGERSFTDIKNQLGEATVLLECVVEGGGKKHRLLMTSVRRAAIRAIAPTY